MNGKNESQSIEELMLSGFDSEGYEEGQEVVFGNISDLNNETSNDDDSDKVDQSEEEKAGSENDTSEVKKSDVETEESSRLFAGQFKTTEELEAAYIGATSNKPVQAIEPENKEGLADLNRGELSSMFEGDVQDGTNWTAGYLQDKMKSRDLEKFELEKLRELDAQNDTDLYGDYVAAKTKREVQAQIDPIIEPIKDERNKKLFEEYQNREKAIVDSYKEEFGDELQPLKDKLTPDFIDEILRTSDMSYLISREFKTGSRAFAYKMLLRESKKHLDKVNKNNIQDKKRKSFPADVGGTKSTSNVVEKAGSIQDAWDAAEREFNS